MGISPGVFRREIKFSLVVNVLLLSSVVGFAAIISIFFFKTDKFSKSLSSKDSAEFVESIVRVLGVIGGITSAVYVGQGLHFNVQKAKDDLEYMKLKDEDAKNESRAESSLRRLNELTTQWVTLVPATENIQSTIRRLEAKHGKHNISMHRKEIKALMEDTAIESLTFYTSSKMLLDFVELLSVSVLTGSLNEDDTFQYFAVVVVRVGDLYKDWIASNQDLKNRKLSYQPLMELFKRWETRVP